jgi:hypothetical protein
MSLPQAVLLAVSTTRRGFLDACCDRNRRQGAVYDAAIRITARSVERDQGEQDSDVENGTIVPRLALFRPFLRPSTPGRLACSASRTASKRLSVLGEEGERRVASSGPAGSGRERLVRSDAAPTWDLRGGVCPPISSPSSTGRPTPPLRSPWAREGLGGSSGAWQSHDPKGSTSRFQGSTP